MFGLGMSEILLIAIVAIVVIGPKRLPEVAKALGKGYAEFRKALDGFKDAVKIDDVVGDNKKENTTLNEVYKEKWKNTSENADKDIEHTTQETTDHTQHVATSSNEHAKEEKPAKEQA